MHFATTYNSPIGKINIYEEDGNLIEVEICDYFSIQGFIYHETQLLKEAKLQLQEYFQKKRKYFNLPYKFIGTEFQKLVWAELAKIPYGQTMSYKDLAIKINHPNAYRAVGGANNRNKLGIIIPCHRVIGHDGKLVGYAGGLHLKKQLLDLEK